MIEAGIGARLDPTRACRAIATCITGVELEHTERLGPTVADIAREKAAIVRPGIPLVTGSMPEPARAVLEAEAVRAGAPLLRLGCDITIRLGDDLPSTGPASGLPKHAHTGRPTGSLRETGPAEIVVSDRTVPVALRQPGRHMVENAALALALADEIGALRRLDDAAAGDALEAADLPGRAEVLRESPLVIADGAHTRTSIEALVGTLEPRHTARLVAVVSVTRGRDAAHLLRPLVRHASIVVATAAEPSRSLSADALARVLTDSKPHIPIEVIPAPADAIRAAVRLAEEDGTVCVTGSMYLAGAARRTLLSG